ncbi:MAG: hypothetical protein ACXVIG_07295 [Halobacteriota archaeon]
MKAQFPPEKHNRIINAHLKSGAIDISATDWMASPALEPKLGNTFAIFVVGGTYHELKTVFDKLAEGASKEWFQELHDMPFGTYGQFFDKYGVQWIFKGEKKNKEPVARLVRSLQFRRTLSGVSPVLEVLAEQDKIRMQQYVSLHPSCR